MSEPQSNPSSAAPAAAIPPQSGPRAGADPQHHGGKASAGLVMACLGVVYGDIGTSPLYALRESLRAVQTPQGFDRAVLVAAHASGAVATDDAALVEALGHDVVVVEGDLLAMKITTVDDLARAERLLATAD